MKTKCLCATLIATTLWQSRAIGQCAAYEATVLEGPFCPLWGTAAGGSAISPNGSICGETGDCGQSYVLIWTGGRDYDTFTFPDETQGYAPLSLNDAGHIVGWWVPYSGSAERAFIAIDGKVTELEPLPNDNQATAHGILNDGRVAGFSGGCAPQCRHHAVVWENGVATALELPMGPSAVAYDLSDTGFVAGWMGVAPHPVFGAHAFIWKNGTVTDLGVPLPGSFTTEARAVNNLGQACGIATYADETKDPYSFWRRGFFWSDGVMQDIGALPDFVQTFALDINDRAEIVGYCLDAAGFNRGFIWRNDVMIAINDLIPRELNLDFVWPKSINNAGQITGLAVNAEGDAVAIIMSPLPDIPGDFNCDRTVNVDDLLAVIQYWNNDINSPADFDQSGQVGVGDLLIVLDNWSL